VARIRSCSAILAQPLSEAWQCARSAAGAAASPDGLHDLHWLPAAVPGTFAAALRAAGEWDGESALELDHLDIWYRAQFAGGADEILHFEGLATLAEVWLNGEPLFASDNMFLPRRVSVRTQRSNELHICFRSLANGLAAQRGRARWRPRLATPSSLRFVRTTLLGHMPGWCPTVHPVGPWRPILREQRTSGVGIEAIDLRTAVLDGEGRVVIRAVLDLPAEVEAVIALDGHEAPLQRTAATVLEGALTVPDVALWWPHTHGTPALSPLTLRLDDMRCELGPVGFRDIAVQRDEDGNGFGIAVNGEPVFCRGACWTNPDIVALPGDVAAYRPVLTAMRDAGMNMVRVGGTMVYEADAFYALCDELGLLVWQDAMLANFDYPAEAAFRASLAAELAHFLDRTQANPSLAVFCGGSEVLQQAAMLGLPAAKVDAALYHDIMPPIVAQHRPDIAYVANSPSGGPWPFQPDVGVTHYYGVGAYLRPLDDARRARVRFASECLALANVPEAPMVEAMDVATTSDPRWKRGVPRDPGAGWDFEDVRDHYLARLFEVDPTQLRWADFARYLDLSRAVSCLLADAVFGEWRRAGSSCRGGLVWQCQDLAPGAGWGVVDSTGTPKPVWHALRRAFRPRQVILTDEGLNGLHVHVLNESATPINAVLRVVCLRDGRHPVREAMYKLTVQARSAVCYPTAVLLSEFFDITYSYKFGPRAHDVTVASLYDQEDDALIADAVHFPAGPNLPVQDLGLQARLERDGNGWTLAVTTQAFAEFLHIEDAAFVAEDNWLHVMPGRERRIRLRPSPHAAPPHGTAGTLPQGEIRALNMDRIVRYAGQA
jgi:beta-mannosidase